MGVPDSEDLGGAADREVRLAEFVALGLFVVEAFVIAGFLAAGIANQVQNGSQQFALGAGHVWGHTLALATEWSDPAAVAVFLVVPLALVVWLQRRGGDELSESRTALVLRLALALAVLTILGGIVYVVGNALSVSPSVAWSPFLLSLGSGLGSLVLGVVGIVVVTHLADDAHLDVLGRPDEGAAPVGDGAIPIP
jgi:hypothetical protein